MTSNIQGSDDPDKQLPANSKTLFVTAKEAEQQAYAALDKIIEEQGDIVGKTVVCGAPLSRMEETADTILEPHTAEGHRERQREKWLDIQKRTSPRLTQSVVGKHGIDWYTYRKNILKPTMDNIYSRLPRIPADLPSYIRERHNIPILIVLVPQALYDDPECLCLMSLIGNTAFPKLGRIKAEVWPDDEDHREKLRVPLNDEISRIKT